MAAIEQDKGHLDRAIEHLSKARGIYHLHITLNSYLAYIYM